MRTLLSAIITLFICNRAQGQVDWAFFGGPQATSAHYSQGDTSQKTQYKYGFHAGMSLKVPFDKQLYFVPQLYYSMKGYKATFNRSISLPDPSATDNDTRIHTLETAFLLQFDFKDKPGHGFFRTGPSLDFQLFGHEKFNTPSGEVSRSMKYGYNDYGHFSANWILQLGYESPGGFMIYGLYSPGITNISNQDEGPKIRHQAFGITIGKYFKYHTTMME
jgi:hypothetical protein